MMRHLALFAIVAVPFFACGGPPTPTPVTTLPSAKPTASAAPAIDLSPVTMPDAVVVHVHAAHATATADIVSQWAGQQLDLQGPLEELVGETIAKVVDADGPADLTITAGDRGGRREPEVRVALSLPVRNFEAAKSTLQGELGLLPIGNGAFEISRTGAHRRDGDSEFRVCALAQGIGGARIVCSHDATSRDLVLPFLTRGVSAMTAIKSDIHIEARPGPFREIVKRERPSITQGGSRFMGGRELRTAWEAGFGDLCDSFLDAEKATLDANIDAAKGSVELKISARGNHGLVTRILTGHPERAEPAPAAFLRLPSDADIALFTHGLDADQVAAPRDELVRAVDAAIADDAELHDADRKAFTAVVGHTLDLLTMPIVYARGVDFAKAIPAVAGLTMQSDAAKIRAGNELAAGWDVIGAEGAPEKVTAVFKEWAAIFARPAFIASMKNDAGQSWKLAATPRGLPAGTVHLALTMSHDDYDAAPQTGTKKRAKIALALHTLIVPDQGRAWIVNALDEATAIARAKAILANVATATLAGRTDLDALKSARLNAGGFITPRGAGMGLPITWLFNWNPRYRATTDPLLGISSSSQYTTPLVFTFAENPVASGESSFTLGFRAPRAALADIMQVGPRIFR